MALLTGFFSCQKPSLKTEIAESKSANEQLSSEKLQDLNEKLIRLSESGFHRKNGSPSSNYLDHSVIEVEQIANMGLVINQTNKTGEVRIHKDLYYIYLDSNKNVPDHEKSRWLEHQLNSAGEIASDAGEILLNIDIVRPEHDPTFYSENSIEPNLRKNGVNVYPYRQLVMSYIYTVRPEEIDTDLPNQETMCTFKYKRDWMETRDKVEKVCTVCPPIYDYTVYYDLETKYFLPEDYSESDFSAAPNSTVKVNTGNIKFYNNLYVGPRPYLPYTFNSATNWQALSQESISNHILQMWEDNRPNYILDKRTYKKNLEHISGKIILDNRTLQSDNQNDVNNGNTVYFFASSMLYFANMPRDIFEPILEPGPLVKI